MIMTPRRRNSASSFQARPISIAKPAAGIELDAREAVPAGLGAPEENPHRHRLHTRQVDDLGDVQFARCTYYREDKTANPELPLWSCMGLEPKRKSEFPTRANRHRGRPIALLSHCA
ncbi:hypothetical protein IscW_ISCW014406 [Ixodes scapularis]|uniref:Uncharacterized protein n=1 Tax=Ixodes scapularis TaxID=6945 RepID=B7QMK4_IXOSC|nr:hypothetical protein IscW_ISCW014406 [Ixodes scapularis]|eukprot:XP_002416409.1 hypothetical protein IscW_ISCW014406 [Ixodes scapularis]